ncbi:MAG: YndJ family transporter [Myxococcaceae bacterium]
MTSRSVSMSLMPMLGKSVTLFSALGGGTLWLVTPFLPLPGPGFASLEHGFLFMPLVASPLGLALMAQLLESNGRRRPRLLRAAQQLQPAAALLTLVSFWLPTGPAAGTLTLGWLAMAVLVAISGLPSAMREAGGRLANLNLLVAPLFLPVGAVWLLLSRLGMGPRHFAATTVLLAALHFHFSGFTLQLLLTATRRALSCRRLLALNRISSVGAVAGIPLIAVGNLASSPNVKLLGVTAMVLATVLLGVTLNALAHRTPERTPRTLLRIAAVSIASAMLLAAVYGVGERTGAGFIGLSSMTLVHGLLNGVGFTLPALLGFLSLRQRP